MSDPSYWLAVSRFGESGLLLPLALSSATARAFVTRQPLRAMAELLPLSLALSLTVASKVAFLGFGIGIAALDFTGMSGHAMLAAAVLPVFAHCGLAGAAKSWRVAGVILACLLAALVAVSRVIIGAHSPSEALFGCLLGLAAAHVAMRGLAGSPGLGAHGLWVVAFVATLAVLPAGTATVSSHALVTRLALAIADRDAPYVRSDLHR